MTDAPLPVAGGPAPVHDRRWLKHFGRTGEGRAGIRLLCFHHAGGSAAIFREWPGRFSPSLEVLAVQLPGRGDRLGEPAFLRMAPLVDELVDVVVPLLDRPFACYGVSMGARVAWMLAHALRARALPSPVRLFLACDPAPAHDEGVWPWENRADGLAGYLRELGGTPPEVLADPGLMRLLLPALRADLDVLVSATERPAEPLDVPILAFAGTDDPTAPLDRMRAWAAETSGRFRLDVVPGGHFFDATGESRVIHTIDDDLAAEPKRELR